MCANINTVGDIMIPALHVLHVLKLYMYLLCIDRQIIFM